MTDQALGVMEIEEREDGALPQGWAWTTLGEVARVNYRDPDIRDLPDDLPVTFVPMAAVDAERGIIAWPEERPVSKVRKGFTPFSNGDVLFAKITPSMENGKAAIARDLENERGFGSTEFHVLSPKPGVLSEWLFYVVRQFRFRMDAKAHFAGTAGQLRVPSSFLESYPIPLAPFAEQHRIVAEIEKQFTRLDAGIAALKRAQAGLKRYKAALLKAACEGRLVPQDPNDEPASELLKRILAERRAKWEADLRSKGRDPKKTKYAEPKEPDVEGLPELPKGWYWATVEQLAAHEPNSITDGPFGSNLKTEHYSESGPRVIRLQNIGDGEFYDEKAHISEEHFEMLRKHQVFVGDLVIAALGESLPRACVLPKHLGLAIVKADCIRFKPHPALATSGFLNVALNSELLKKVAARIIHGVGRPRLNQQEIKSLPIPLPPLNEQHRIVAEVEQRLSVVKVMEAAVAANLARAERLRQSILKRAFAGRLVPQDPSDEPAAVLVERIRRQRAESSQSDKGRRPLHVKAGSVGVLLPTRRTRKASPKH